MFRKKKKHFKHERILDETEATGSLLGFVEADDDPLDVTTLGEELVHLLLGGVEGQVSHIQRAALLQQLLLLITVALQRSLHSFPAAVGVKSTAAQICLYHRWTLDFVYTTVKHAYKAEPHPHLGYSDHISVMLIPCIQTTSQTCHTGSKADHGMARQCYLSTAGLLPGHRLEHV